MTEALYGCFSEDIHQTCEQECYSWQNPSIDVLENILQRVSVGDRIRMSIVSKPWNSIVTRRDICGAPHELVLPWLLLLHPRRWKYLSFHSLSEGKVVKLKPLKQVQGGWIYGSTKGSLIIVKEQGLKSTIFIVNPISGLPPLKTITSFQKLVQTKGWKRFGAILFCPRIVISISDNTISNCWTMAAAIIVHNNRTTLGVCRPGDNTWSLFEVLDSNRDDFLVDILFSSGTLYALVDSNQKDGEVAATRSLELDNGVELKMKLIYDKDEFGNSSIDEMQGNDYAGFTSSLSESTNNEVLIIHQMLDDDVEDNNNIDEDQDYDDNEGNIGNYGGGLNIVEENDENIYLEHGDEEDNHHQNEEAIDEEVPSYTPHTTRCFRVYKIDPDNDDFVPIQSLGDQLLFLGEDTSFSLPASDFEEEKKNCIYFATNYFDFKSATRTYPSREIGVFYFTGERIKQF